ncbi:hypothetical protein PR003_g15708, partial [Phytophthora rubi]
TKVSASTRERCRVNQAKYRQRQREFADELDATISELREAIEALEEQRDTIVAHIPTHLSKPLTSPFAPSGGSRNTSSDSSEDLASRTKSPHWGPSVTLGPQWGAAWGREGEMGCSCAPGTDAAPCLVSATKTVINIAAPDDLHVYPRSTPSAPDLAAP